MSAAIARQAGLMLQAPWQWRRNDGGLWALRLYGALMALLLGGPAVAALVWMPLRAAWTMTGVLAFLALAWVWCIQFGALLRLDHPHTAHAVPGHPRALRVTTLGLWGALVALCGAASALGAALLLGDGLRFGLAVATGAGTILLLLAMAMRWWWVWIPLCLGPTFIPVPGWNNIVFGSWAWMRQQWLDQPLGATLLVLAMQGLLLTLVFGSGNARHAVAYASRERMRRSAAAGAAGQKPTLAAYGRWAEWLGLPWQRLSDAWLAHVCRQASARPASVMARAEIVLHGPQHWVRHVSTVLMVQMVLALCFVFVTGLTGLSARLMLDNGRAGLAIGLTSMALSGLVSLPGALWMSRREQALLRLVPGMPQGAALNRAVAWRLMRHCLAVWAALLPAGVTMVWAGQGLPFVAFVAMALPMSAWLWCDVSRLRAARPATAFAPILLCMASGGLSLFVLSRQADALLPWAVGLILLTAGLLSWRWRRLAQFPPALPAGRLS